MTAQIHIQYQDDAYARIYCEDLGIGREMSERFTFMVPNARHMPKFKNKMWDGKIRLYNEMSKQLYTGLVPYVIQFARDNNYTVSASGFKNVICDVTREDTDEFVKSLDIHNGGKPITPYEHQLNGIHHAIRNKRCLLESATGSGKSLIIYSLMRWFQASEPRKTLLIVPDVSLVLQMKSDFADYASNCKDWNVDENVHVIYEGQSKVSPAPIFVSTWQSIYKLPRSFFQQFGQVIVDECHTMKAESITGIMTKLVDCPYRIGTSGTIKKMEVNLLVLEGLCGKNKLVAKASDLIEKNILSKLQINCISLVYPDAEKKRITGSTYDEEIDYLISNPLRNQFIVQKAMEQEGNTLILVRYVEKHGDVLHRMLLDAVKGTNRNLYYINGTVAPADREPMRKSIEVDKNAILLATYKTLSRGVNIKRLHNVIFASPIKDEIGLIQSIGRQLRLADDKTVATLWDIADDLCWKSKKNYSYLHLIDRVKTYISEKYPYKHQKVPLL